MCFFLIWLYHPPKHPRGIPWSQAFRELDYFGAVLFTMAIVLVLVGICYSLTQPSTSPKLIATLVAGFIGFIIFALWETFAPLKQPLTPTRIWTRDYGREFTAPWIVGLIVTMFFYAINITYPTMIDVFFTNPSSPKSQALKLSLPQGLGITAGAILLSTVGKRLRNYKTSLTTMVIGMVLFGGLSALATPEREGMTIAFVFLNQLCYGWCQYLTITFIQFGVDQVDLGISGGLAGVARTAGGSVAIAVFSTILGTTQRGRAAKLVPVAVIAAGGTAAQAPAILAALPLGPTALDKVPGLTTAIAEAAGGAFVQSYVYGLK